MKFVSNFNHTSAAVTSPSTKKATSLLRHRMIDARASRSSSYYSKNSPDSFGNIWQSNVMPDAFLCSINDVKVNNSIDQRARNVLNNVEGFLRQKISGQGLAFLVGGGSVVQKNLEVTEVLAADVSNIVALSASVNVQIKYNGPMRRVVFGGDNLVTAVLTGPGIVFIQSMPFQHLSQRVARAVTSPNMRENPKFFVQIAIFFFIAYVIVLSSLILTDL